MIAANTKQRVLRILAFAAAMLPALAWPQTTFQCSGEAAKSFDAAQNDLDPTKACVLKLTFTNAANLTGLSGGESGRILVLENAGSTVITLVDASSSSSVGNRFQFPANIALPAAASVFLRYDAGTREWKAVSPPAGEDAAFADDVAVTGDLTVTGATALNGTAALTGATTLSGTIVSPTVFSTNGVRLAHGTAALTKAGGAETVLTITNATTQATGMQVFYRIAATDATDYAVRTGSLLFSCNNLAGTTTSTSSPTDETTGSVIETTNAKTLTYAITDTNAANTCVLKFNIDSDMAGTVTGTIFWSAFVFGPGTIS